MAGSGSQSSAGSVAPGDKPIRVEEMIGKLKKLEREEDDLIFEEEFPDEIEEAKCMALATVHTNKPFSRGVFYDTMRLAWSLP